jgi:AraC-like DNA-binding protein
MTQDGLAPSQAAHRVGYDSLAAFSCAYKRVTGQLPGAVHRGRPTR